MPCRFALDQNSYFGQRASATFKSNFKAQGKRNIELYTSKVAAARDDTSKWPIELQVGGINTP
jgi:hypothetical protein